SRAKKQSDVILSLFLLKSNEKHIRVKDLKERSQASAAIIKTLIDKGVLDEYFLNEDRVSFEGEIKEQKELSESQQTAYETIKSSFVQNDVSLFYGVTSSGKTEIYIKLIQDYLDQEKQILYLLPEIALTTQLISRLQNYFGDKIAVFHSKYSINERVEVWNNLLAKKAKAQIIIGARSSVLLPFSNLGLIVVDEEHETSFKQFDPAPRYHARDAAIVLAKLHGAKVLLGSATPSIESFFNAKKGKYGLIVLKERFGNILLPDINLIDIKEKFKKRLMKGHFSDTLIKAIEEALDEKEQVILFQNRRGYSPILECNDCGNAAQCPNCDVSLTYHQYKNQLRCHYCGYQMAMQHNCISCGSNKLSTKGFGTEQIEEEIKQLFPEAKVGRMDLDTTRGKHGYKKIISAFENQELDILVGTQMLTKGLDFKHVSLVGIMNADSMLNFPDFRSHERSYQLMQQVAGRSGRYKKRGKVLIQTYNPYHKILHQVSTNAYEEMYEEQLDQRHIYKYPPTNRLIKISFKHRDYSMVSEGAQWFWKSLDMLFKPNVLGPEFPAIARIRN
ncbi:MAG: primosomal protein N', partial [Flavobacteriaceae bacterium]|nr:primosomal protein N' [Flavobacteriaceae bacterium]